MGEVRSFFDSFKEFVWDIIGYLIPGLYLVILVSFFITRSYLIDLPIMFEGNEGVVLIVLSYVLGYIVYGLGDIKEKLRGKKSYSKQVLMPISKLPVFLESKEILKRKDPNNVSFNQKLDTIEVRELRNIVMSYVPEADQKIYTFTFRSELSRHTGLISLVVGSICLLSTIIQFKWPEFDLFKQKAIYIALYLLLIMCYFLLREPRDKFYRIAMTMPFNLFLAKEKM